jgi:hypothetical protein
MEPNGGTTTAGDPQPATTGTINMEPITGSNTTEPHGGPKTEGNPPTKKPVISRAKKPRKITTKKGGDSSGSTLSNNNDQSSGGIKQLLDTLFR